MSDQHAWIQAGPHDNQHAGAADLSGGERPPRQRERLASSVLLERHHQGMADFYDTSLDDRILAQELRVQELERQEAEGDLDLELFLVAVEETVAIRDAIEAERESAIVRACASRGTLARVRARRFTRWRR